MLMVIFGAGASFDSAQAFPSSVAGRDGRRYRPPLANDLFSNPGTFDNLVSQYPHMRSILPLLRARAQGSVEQILERFLGEEAEHPDRYAQLASVRYYLRDLLQLCTTEWLRETCYVTNYEPLIDQILHGHGTKTDPICLVTFNYDLLLDTALYNHGFQVEDLGTFFFRAHPTLKLFKLHGSVDWARYVHPDSFALSNLIADAAKLKLTTEYTRAHTGETSRDGQPLFPAIAIPVQTKSDFECPASHLTYLTELLMSVTKILIIGWQAREGHFLTLLRSVLPALKRIMVVSGDSTDAKKVLDHFKHEIRPEAALRAICETTQGGFTDFVVHRRGDEFFKDDGVL